MSYWMSLVFVTVNIYVCVVQYEDDILPYLNISKLLYKELLT